MNSITITLPTGTFDIEYADALLERIRLRFGIPVQQDVTPGVIKLYLEQELASALSKEPKEET